MKISQTYADRRARLREVIDTLFNGSQTKFSEQVGVQPDYISRCLSGTKNIGEELAREWEEKARLPDYYFDARHEISPDQLRWNQLLAEMSDQERQLLFKMFGASVKPNGTTGKQ